MNCGALFYWYEDGMQQAGRCDEPAVMETRAIDGSRTYACAEHGADMVEAGATATLLTVHDWTDVPEGTALTGGVPFQFCTRCDREVWQNGTVRPGTGACEENAR